MGSRRVPYVVLAGLLIFGLALIVLGTARAFTAVACGPAGTVCVSVYIFNFFAILGGGLGSLIGAMGLARVFFNRHKIV